ncbi:type II secretion system protein [Cryobacterium sp. TMT1-3]|uniref:type IV pilus modification PilV family protein n=1 Tax=Cryobacterium sp. TMT1-3 TaxID=1259237 RepID=UPI0011034D59|nr:type II secretion system protein [Cryobacterium sp. TMT1-3]TFC27485.1 type II secretion system protein [Cryobacterium sp. TMT1-3]
MSKSVICDEYRTCERGFGIIEIVVSMLLLGLLAIGFLPLLMQSMRVSATNATLATATQLVEMQMEQIRDLDPTCQTLKTFKPTPPTDIRLTATVDVVCPAVGEVQTARVVVSVSDATGVVSQAVTLIYVLS